METKPKKKKVKLDYSPFFRHAEAILGVKFTKEFCFREGREFRFDFAVLCCNLAVEIEGGAFGGKGHRGITNFNRDMKKYTMAAIDGWRIMRFTVKDLQEEYFMDTLHAYFENHPCIHNSADFFEQIKRSMASTTK